MIVHFARPDGQEAPAYLAEPSSGTSGLISGLILVQEWWGLNEQIRQVADRIAEVGYRVLVPDLYRGKLAANATEAEQLMNNLNLADVVGQDVTGSARYLRGSSPKVGIMGFCLGGAITLAAAAHLSELLSGAVCFYGIPPATDLSQIRMPVQAHFANQDDWCTPAAVDAMEAQLQRGAVSHELYRYEAQHAFFNQERPEVYAPEAAELAWERTMAFWRAHLAV